MLITFLVFATITIIFLFVALFILYPRKKKVSTIPGLDPTDDKLGNIGEIHDAGSMHEFLVQLHQEHGPVASFWFGPQFCVSVASVTAFKDVQNLFDRPRSLFEFCLPLIGEKSIQLANGEDGKRRHKIYSEVLGHQTCCLTIPKFVAIGKELVSAWMKLPEDEHVPVHAYMMAVAIKMVSATQFGAYFRDDDTIKNFHQLYEKVMDDLNGILMGSFSQKDRLKYQKFEQNLKNFKAQITELIRVHVKARQSGDYEDAPLLNTILDHAKDDEEAVSDVISFIVGGFHTTGNFLAWLIYYLSICPEVQKKMILEVDNVLRGKNLDETFASQLTYTWQVLEETLRASVTAPFAARVNQDREIRILGHLVPPETPVVCALGVSLNDSTVFPDPGKFDPERFNAESTRKRPSLAYVPFGIGQRRCPGYKFSKFEALSIVVTLLQNFSFKPAFDNDYFVEPSFGFVTKPETEIWINIKSRHAKA